MSIGSGSGENAAGKDTLKLTKVSFRLLLQSKHIIDRTPEYISQIRIPILAFQGGKDDYSTQDDNVLFLKYTFFSETDCGTELKGHFKIVFQST